MRNLLGGIMLFGASNRFGRATSLLFLAVGVLVVVVVFGSRRTTASEQEEADAAGKRFVVYPIGVVRVEEGRTWIELEEKYKPGLLGVDKLEYINVYYWFDRNDTPEKRAILQVHPRGDKNNPLTGVFATRSPMRPNLIAQTRCKVLGVHDNILDIDAIDAFDKSPVIDLKVADRLLERESEK